MKKFIAIGAALAMLAAATPAYATVGWWWNQSDPSTTIKVTVSNNASVTNNVETEAETGDNDADGGSARNYVRGGNVDDTIATGGDADIDTGNAEAWTTVHNDVNYTKTSITAGCDCEGDLDSTVSVRNTARVLNNVETEAETGDNDADGGDAKNKVKASSKKSHSWFPWVNSSSSSVQDTTATGGDADINTGDSYADSMVTNLVNHTITRIRR